MYKGRGFSARKSKRARQLATKNENIANVAVAHVLGTLCWVLHIQPMVFDDFRVPEGTPAGTYMGPRWYFVTSWLPNLARSVNKNKHLGPEDPYPREVSGKREEGRW